MRNHITRLGKVKQYRWKRFTKVIIYNSRIALLSEVNAAVNDLLQMCSKVQESHGTINRSFEKAGLRNLWFWGNNTKISNHDS